VRTLLLTAVSAAIATLATAQAPVAYPARPPADPAAVARGKAIYGVQCAFCHGEDARGGDAGPNLIRSQLVLNDQNGELIAPVLANGRVAEGMPKFEFSAAQVTDIAAFIHSFRVLGYDAARNRPQSLLTGDAKAGEAAYTRRCATCHKDAAAIKAAVATYDDTRTQQQRWLMPGGAGRGGRSATPATVVITQPSGQKVEGRLVRIDDFVAIIADNDGVQRSFRLDAKTKAEIRDPLQGHKDLLRVYTDKEIHDITAYLVKK